MLNAWALRLPAGIPVAGGGGENAAGGVGVVRPGDAFLSIGTSGVLFAVGDRFAPNAERAVHAFCHCLPQTTLFSAARTPLIFLFPRELLGDSLALLRYELPRATLPLLDPIGGTREVHRDLTHRWIVASDHDLIGG